MPKFPKAIYRLPMHPIVGEYWWPYGGAQAVIATVANTLYAFPISVPRTVVVDRIAIEVTVADAGRNARVGIYADDGTGMPGALVVDAGLCSVAAVAVVPSGAIATTLEEGLLYWMALLSDGVATLRGMTSQTLNVLASLTAASFYYSIGRVSVAQAYGALPDPFTGGGAYGGIPLCVTPRILSLG